MNLWSRSLFLLCCDSFGGKGSVRSGKQSLLFIVVVVVTSAGYADVLQNDHTPLMLLLCPLNEMYTQLLSKPTDCQHHKADLGLPIK